MTTLYYLILLGLIVGIAFFVFNLVMFYSFQYEKHARLEQEAKILLLKNIEAKMLPTYPNPVIKEYQAYSWMEN